MDIGEKDLLFSEERKKVLSEWPTGKEVDIGEAVSYHNNLPENKKVNHLLRKAQEQEKTLLQCLGGFASFQRLLAFYKDLIEYGCPDILTLKVDSFTQNKKFQRAKEDYENELSHDKILLDGFPLVVHGISGCRRLIENNEVPIQVRHEGADVRLIAEIALASGLTDFLGGGLCNSVFNPQVDTLRSNMEYWNYVDSLVGLYEGKGVRINREIIIPLSGTLIPPSLQIAILILDGLMAAKCGSRSITLCYNQCGNLIQDVAALSEVENLFLEYLEKSGDYNTGEFEVYTSLYQWPGGFPEDESRGYSIIALGAMVASLANATKVVVRTPLQTNNFPDQESYIKGLKATDHMLKLTKNQGELYSNERLEEESEIIKGSVRSILDVILSFDAENMAYKVTKAFEDGVLDLPFSSFGDNLGLVMPVRDDKGAVRFFDSGKLPLPEKIKKYNRDHVNKRAWKENREPSFQMVIDDIYAVGKGLIFWDEG